MNLDAHALQAFIGDVALGNIGDSHVEVNPRHLKAFRMLQMQTQYLLYSHQALRERSIEMEKRLGKLQKHEAAAKKKTQARKERIRTLAAEAQAQDDVSIRGVAYSLFCSVKPRLCFFHRYCTHIMRCSKSMTQHLHRD